MYFRLKLTFSLFLVTLFCSPTYGQDSAIRIERAPIVIAETQLLAAPVDYRISDGGRNWSSTELLPENIRHSFNDWFTCFQSSTPECQACATTRTQTGVVVLMNVLGNNCLPPQSDAVVAYSPNLLPHQKQLRDDRICDCYQAGKAGPIENFNFAQGVRSRSERGRVWERERAIRDSATEERVGNRIMTERFSTGFSAASYLNNPADALELASRYSASRTADSGGRTRNKIMSAFGQRGRDGADSRRSSAGADAAEREELTRDLFNGTRLPENYCIPYRNFLASKQFPINTAFYRDLDSLTTFNAKDWDFTVLLDELRSLTKAAGGYEQALAANPRAKAINFRLRFLHNNPAMKNLFLASGNEELKSELFRKIKNIPRPSCGAETCTRDANWAQETQAYRRGMAEFMSRQNVIDAARSGSHISREMQVMLAEDEARMISASSDLLIPEGERTNPASWRTFCDARQRNREANASTSTGFLQQLFETFGNRDFKNYEEDTEFRRANTEVCNTPRTTSNGQRTFNQFFATTCGTSRTGDCSDENRSTLVSRYMQSSTAIGTQSATAASLLPFMNGYFNLAAATQTDIDHFNEVARSPSLASRPVSFSGSEYVALNNNRGDARALTPGESSLARTEVQRKLSEPQNTQSQFPYSNQPVAGVETPIFIPQARAVRETPDPVAIARSELNQGETRSRDLSNELSSIRSLLRKETSTPTPDSSAVSGFNQKISELERKFRDQTQENQRLQDQLTTAERVATTNRAEPDGQQVTRRPASVPEASAASVIAPQAGGNGGAASLPVFSGGSVRSGSSPSSGGRTSPSSRESSSGDLGRFGVENTTERNGITVADVSSGIDYNRLRSESANSVLPITVTSEEFGQYSENIEAAISRYVDRVRAMPGEVVRVELQNGSQSMEVFVVKYGNQISIVQAEGRMSDRRPAAVNPTTDEREFTLQGLQNELTR